MHSLQIDGLFETLDTAASYFGNILTHLPRDDASFHIAPLHTFDNLTILWQQRHSARIFNEDNQTQCLGQLNDAMQIAQVKPFLLKVYLRKERSFRSLVF